MRQRIDDFVDIPPRPFSKSESLAFDDAVLWHLDGNGPADRQVGEAAVINQSEELDLGGPAVRAGALENGDCGELPSAAMCRVADKTAPLHQCSLWHGVLPFRRPVLAYSKYAPAFLLAQIKECTSCNN